MSTESNCSSILLLLHPEELIYTRRYLPAQGPDWLTDSSPHLSGEAGNLKTPGLGFYLEDTGRIETSGATEGWVI